MQKLLISSLAVAGVLSVNTALAVTAPPFLEQAKLSAPGSTNNSFGDAVALSGSTALVGDSEYQGQIGRAFVYVFDGSAWHEQAELTPSDAVSQEDFGYSVAIDGDTAIVGAYGQAQNLGAAYIFVRNGTVWTQQAKLTGPVSQGIFGAAVAVAGDTAVVGAPDATGPGHSLRLHAQRRRVDPASATECRRWRKP